MSELCNIAPQVVSENDFQNLVDLATGEKGFDYETHPIWKAIDSLSDEFLSSKSFQEVADKLKLNGDNLKRRLAIHLLSEYESRNSKKLFIDGKGSPNKATSTRLWGNNFDIFNTLAGCITDAKEDGYDSLVELYQMIADEIALQQNRQVNIKTLFNPSTKVTAQFTACDHAQVAKMMVKTYFDNLNTDLGVLYPDSFNEGDTLKTLTNAQNVKSVMIALLKDEIDRAKEDKVHTRYNDLNVEYLIANLENPNSSVYRYFVSYIKEEGIDLTRKGKNKNSERLNEESVDDRVENAWDNTEYLDRKNSLSDIAKQFLSSTLGRSIRESSRANKFYLNTPMDVRSMWPHLVGVFRSCKTRDEFRTKINNLRSVFPELEPLAEKFDEAFDGKNEDSIQLVNSIIAGLGMAVTPVDVLAINDNGVELLTRNKEAFPQRTVADRITSSIKSIITNKDLDVEVVTVGKKFKVDGKTYDFTKKYLNTEDAIDKQLELLNTLGIDVNPKTLEYYYAQFAEGDMQNAYSSIDYYIGQLLTDINKNKGKKGDEISLNTKGIIYNLSGILTTDLYSPVSMTYMDVEDNLGYTPQYDSFLTKFTRNWVVDGKVNTQAILDTFHDLLHDPIINNPASRFNLLMYNKDTGTGIFVRNDDGSFSVASKFIDELLSGKQFNIAAFNGLLLGDKGMKYRVINGSLYSFTELALALPKTKDDPNHGRYTFLTSDSPRSYTVSTKQIGIEDLFDTSEKVDGQTITDCRINREANIFKYLVDIVNSDFEKFKLYGNKIFSLENNEDIINYHNVKYWNGRYNKDGSPQIFNKGIPTGRAFQFLNISYKKNGKNYTIIDYIADTNNVEKAAVYAELVKLSKGESYNTNLVPNQAYIEEFVENYIRWNATQEINKLDDIADTIYKKLLIPRGVRKYNQAEYDAKFDKLKREWAADFISKHDDAKLEELLDRKGKYGSIADTAFRGIQVNLSHSYSVTNSDGYRLNMLKIFLNKTIQTKFINDVFEGSLDEYTNTVDYNKRISQVTKIGMNLIELENPTDNRRNVLVIDDFKFGSNIVNTLFGKGAGQINNDLIKRLHNSTEKINDSQSFITDKTLIKFLKATGRWTKGSTLRRYVEDLMDSTTEFNPTTYVRLIEQLKCFGTCRRARNSFLPIYQEGDPFGQEVDTVQIKDSTVVLFKNAVKGSALEEMYDFMDNNEIDQISPISAVKVSGITPVTIHDKSTGAFKLPTSKNLAQHTLKMLNSDFVIQQDMPSEIIDDDAVLGSQLIKQIVEGLDWNNAIYEIDGNKVTGQELFKDFQKTLTANITEDALEFIYGIASFKEDGTLDIDQNGHIKFDIKKVLDVCKDMIDEDTDAINVRQMLELDENGNSRISLSHPLIAHKLERLLAAKISKLVGGKHLNGFAAPIRPDIFTVNNDLIDHNNDGTTNHRDIYAREGDSEEVRIAKKAKYDALIDKFNRESSITWSSDFIERCKREGRPLTLQAEHRTEDGKDFIYAEVITSAWKKEFYETIGTTKEIDTGEVDENGNSIMKTIYTIDLDKLSPEARRMVGIRIPTEGKQSMVVFEVVGILNTGATQTIFPQTLVNRTGWDFDIDKIFAYWRAVKFNPKGEQYKYEVIKFDASESAKTEQKSSNFATSVFKEQTDRVKATSILNSMEELDGNTSDYANVYEYIGNHYHKDIDDSTTKQMLSYVDKLLSNKKLDKSTKRSLIGIKRKLHSLENTATKIYNIYNDALDIYNDLADLNDITDHEAVRYLDSYGKSKLFNLYNSVRYFKDQVVNIQRDLEKLETTNRTINDLKSIANELSKTDITGNNDIEDFIKNTDTEIETETNKVVNALKKSVGYKEDIYKNNSRDARDNHLLDIITSVLSNSNHAVEVNKPNIMPDIIAVSEVVNGLYGFNLEGYNPLNFNDSIGLNNMSMGSTVLKGHSVNFDTLIATLSTMNAQLSNPIKKAIHISQVPLPPGFKSYDQVYTVSQTGRYHMTKEYRDYISNIIGTHIGVGGRKVNNFTFKENGTIIFQDRYINNDCNNTHLDISGGRIEFQANQVTSAVLDILKSSLGSAINIHTLSLFRTLCLGTSTEMYNGNLNRFAYPMMFIHQPCVMEMLDYINANLITDPYINFKKAYDVIKERYYKELVDTYIQKVEDKDIVAAESHKYIVENRKSAPSFNLDLLDEIADALYEEFDSFKGDNVYQTTQELESNIANRDTDDRAKYLINQIKVLRALQTYTDITDELVNMNFVIKTNTDVQTFFHADSKAKQLSDCYYPTSKIIDALQESYNASLPEADGEYAEDFFRNTDLKAFKKKWGDLVNQRGDVISRIPYKLYKEAIESVNGLSTVGEKEAFMNKYGISIKRTKSIIVDANGDELVSKIFTKQNTPLYKQLSDTIDSESVYQSIEATFEYTHRLMAESFDEIFIHRIPEVRKYIMNMLSTKTGYVSQKAYNDLVKNFLAYTSTVPLYGSDYSDVPSVFDESDTELAKQILGIEYESDTDKIKILTKANLAWNIDPAIFASYSKLSLKDQLYVLKHNKTLRNYIKNNPEFNGVNILESLDHFERRVKKPYDEFRLDVNDNQEHLHNLYMNSIAIMWKSNIPFVAHTIRQLIAHQALTNGLTYGYNVSKYIPAELFNTEIENETYQYYLEQTGVKDITRNLHHVNAILTTNHRFLKERSGVGTVNDVLANIMPALSKMATSTHGIMPSFARRKKIWDSGDPKATFGYVGSETTYGINIPSAVENVADKRAYYETEWRLMNSALSGHSIVTMRNSQGENTMYEKILVRDNADPRYKVYAFIPTESKLAGEHAIVGKTDSLISKNNLATEITLDNGQTLSINEYLQTGVDEFLKLVAERNTFGKFTVEEVPSSKSNQNLTDGDPQAGEADPVGNDGETTSESTAESEVIEAPFNVLIYDKPIVNQVNKPGSLSNTVSEVITNSDNSVYITRSGRATHTPTGSGQIAQNLHLQQKVTTVDYTKSPAEEALRIAKTLKSGKLYLNGDTKDLVDMSTNDMYHWTQAFVNNLELIAPKIEVITTIINSGFGQMVARVNSKSARESINIYDNSDVLFNTIVVNDPTVDTLNNIFVINGDIANSIMSNIKKVHRYLERISGIITNQFDAALKDYRSKAAELDVDIQEALAVADREAVGIAYEHIVKLSQLVYKACLDQYQMLNAMNYEQIHNNYGQTLDYKEALKDLLKLIGYFDKYRGLQPIDIQDTEYSNGTEEDIENYKKEFGELNSRIIALKKIARDAEVLKAKSHNMCKRVLTWKIIDESRNPKFTTAFSKVLEYLESHDYTLEGFDEASLEISEDEFLQIQSILFSFDKDISWWMAKLDSAFVTGVPIIDMVGKSWDEANLRAKRYINQTVNDVNKALEEFETGLSKDEKKRVAITRKFVNDEGDFIESYDTKGLYGAVRELQNSIIDAINDDYDSNDMVRTSDMNLKLDRQIMAMINEFNDNQKWGLTELTREEQTRLDARFNSMGEREKSAYIRREHLVPLSRQTVGGGIETVYYKIDFTNTPKSAEFEALNDNEKVLLGKLKDIIQDIIYNYNPEWIIYDSEADLFIPYIPQATLKEALRGYISIPKISHEEYYIDVDGSKQTILKAHTLRLPEKYSQFKYVGKNAKYFNETTSMWKERIIETFNEWVKTNAPEHLRIVAKSKRDIDKFNEAIKRENKKYKAQTMSYDIVDIITGTVQELSQLKAIANYHLDHEIADSLMRHDDGTGSFATRNQIAYSQFMNQESRIQNVSKINNPVDVFASGLLRYTSMTYMYLNYTAGLTNIIKGVTDMMTHSSAYGFVGSKELFTKGIADIIKLAPQYIREIKSTQTDNLDVAIVKDFDDIYQDTRDVQSSMTGTSMWIKMLKAADTAGYMPNTMGEFTMQFGMLLACTHSHRVVGGQIMAFQDFYQQQLEKAMLEVLDEDQRTEYARFKVDLDKAIARKEKKNKKEYHWSHNYASEFIKNNLNNFNKEQRAKLVGLLNESQAKQEEAFKQFPTVHESLELKDGQLSYKEGSGLNEQNMAMFRSRVKSINQSLHGIYNRVDRNSLQDSAIGDLFMQFKKWVIPNWNRMFGRQFGHVFYNEQLNAYEVPTFNIMFDMIRQGNRNFSDSLSDKPEVKEYLLGVGHWFAGVYKFLRNIRFYYQTLPANEKASVIHLAKYAGALAFATIALGIFKGLDDDDEDEANSFKNGVMKHAQYTLTTYRSELMQVIPIIGWWMFASQQLDSLFAGEKTLSLAMELTSLIVKGWFSNADDMLYDRGAYKGEDKRLVKLRQLIPVWRQINKATHLGSTMSYYNRYSDRHNITDLIAKTFGKATDSDYDED